MLEVVFDVIAPVFTVVAIGFIVARTIGATPQTLATLSYWVLGPAFIFDILANADLDPTVVSGVVVATALVMVSVGAIAAIIMRLAGASYASLAATVLTSVHGNVGNFGLAISAFALGAAVLPIAGIVMVTTNTLGILTGVGLARLRHGSVWRAARVAATSPLALAVIPALAVNGTDTVLPPWAARPVSLLAAALIPVMLLTLGIQIAGMTKVTPRPLVVIPISLKLVAAPLIAVALTESLGLARVPAQVVVLLAAMPSAVFTSLVALEHDLEADYVTSVVLVGTVVSAATMPVVISLL